MLPDLGVFDDWELDQLKAVSPQLRIVLRRRIIQNDLPPGSRISEPEVAKQYNVSRQPVREAFITLVNEGLLEIRPQRGTFVKYIDYEAVLGGRFVREAVEADIVKKLAVSQSAELSLELHSQIDLQLSVADSDPEQFIKLDEQFHQTLAKAAGMRKAWDFLEAIKSQMDRVRFITFENFPVARLIEQHQQIVKAIEKNDPALAEDATRVHLREILKSLPKVLQLYPDYFENSGAGVPE